jgi:hypothetical protein
MSTLRKDYASERQGCRASVQFAGDPEPTVSDIAEGRLFICECGHKVGYPEQQHDGRKRLYSLDGYPIDGRGSEK